jgi:zinc transport system substrate-binding protein
MRSRRNLIGVCIGMSVATIGCSDTAKPDANTGQGDGTRDQIEVISTFAPITSFAKAVAGDRAKVTQLIPNNVSPHDYQARPEDVLKLQKADVVIENGLEFEPFLESMIEASENQDVVVIDSSKGIDVSDLDVGEAHEGEEHNEAHKAHERENKQAQTGDNHEGHAHGGQDPHIWLDPKRAIQQVENIREGLIEADPEGKETYQANAQGYIDQLKALDAEFTEQLQPYYGKAFVTYHDFAQYLAQSYGLTAEFLVGVPSENASPEDVARVIDAVKASNLKTLMTEPQIQNDPFSALAKDLEISVSQFDPMDSSFAGEIQADSYIMTMQNNLKNISAAFSAQSQQSFLFHPSFQTSVRSGFAVIPNPLFNSMVTR